MNSLSNEAGTSRGRSSRWLAIIMCLAVAALSIRQTWTHQPGSNEQQIAKAEDEVYEAVIRDIVPQLDQTRGMRLVFDDRLIVGDFPGGDAKSCQAASAKWVQVTDEPPPFDTSADKMYRVLTSGAYRTTPRPDAVESFLKRR